MFLLNIKYKKITNLNLKKTQNLFFYTIIYCIFTKIQVENDLDKLKSASSQSELLESARQFGRSANELAAQAARRQKELKEPRMKDELAAARAVLKKHSTMLLTASKVGLKVVLGGTGKLETILGRFCKTLKVF